MALPTWYHAGTVSVESGSTTVIATGALWGTGQDDDNIMVGDLFSVPSQPLIPAIPIAGITADGEVELLWPWPGDDVEDQPYIIRYVGIIERSTRANRMALERMADVSAWADVMVEDDDARLALETEGNPLRKGYRVLVKEDGVIWAKATSAYDDWIGPVEFKGDKGDKGWTPQFVAEVDGERRVFKLSGYTGGEGTAPTANVGQYLKADGTWTSTKGDAADFRGESLISKGDYNSGTAYVKGNYVQRFGSSWVLTAATSTGNAPPTLPTTSNTWWQLLARQGIDGAGTVNSIVAGDGVEVDNTDPTNPVISASTDALAFYSVTNMETAERASGNAILAGPDGNGVFDGFSNLGFVDAAGATNLDSSVAGRLKPTPATTTTETAGPLASPTDFTAFTMGDRSWKLTNGQVCTKIGYYMRALGSPVTFSLMIVKRNSAGNYDVVVSESLTVTPLVEAFVDKTLTTPFAVPATGDYYVAVKTTSFSSAVAGGARFYFTGTASGTGVTFTEDSGNRIGTRATQISGNNNVVVASSVITTSVAPTWAMLFAFAKLNTAVLNTDFIMAVTRNNSAYQNLTLTEKYARADGSKLYVSGRVSITSTSGSSCRWRWTTANGKAPELLAAGLLLGS